MLVHIDEGAIAAVSHLLGRLIPPDSEVLDLFSSYRSHWPKEHPKKRMVGLGMNAVEMEHNPDLDEYLVYDANHETTLPFFDESFDAVVITVSMQYITHPVETFREVNRILRPGGRFLVMYSNRMFHTKAVYIWLVCNDQQRGCLIATYLDEAGNFTEAEGFYVPPQAEAGSMGTRCLRCWRARWVGTRNHRCRAVLPDIETLEDRQDARTIQSQRRSRRSRGA